MPLKKECCSLELARQLKELGVEQNSLFYWVEDVFRGGGYTGDYYLNNEVSDEKLRLYYSEERAGHYYSAFTSSELGEMLPWYFSIEKHTNDWRCGFVNAKGKMKDVPTFSAETMANAMAKMMAYLLKNKLI